MDENNLLWKVSYILGYALWGLSAFVLNSLRLRMSAYDRIIEDILKMINANSIALERGKTEAAEKYASKVDLTGSVDRLTDQMETMANDIKQILREVRK